MAKKNSPKKDSSKSGNKTKLKQHKRSAPDGRNQKGTGPRQKK
ncbi:hypothetical protein [Winogradskyella maritima]|uniref:23S rRNA (Guanosine2251-2'-O)-methyltransferase n=1 Tax=Winogradskyella maritima TaxID=1517766 RepID=A0ABV8AJ77_9FLAO